MIRLGGVPESNRNGFLKSIHHACKRSFFYWLFVWLVQKIIHELECNWGNVRSTYSILQGLEGAGCAEYNRLSGYRGPARCSSTLSL